MLSDLERKVLRIIWNLHRQAWAEPDLAKICRLAGREEKEVRTALKVLRDTEYIEVRPGELRVLEGWERSSPKPRNWWDKFR